LRHSVVLEQTGWHRNYRPTVINIPYRKQTHSLLQASI